MIIKEIRPLGPRKACSSQYPTEERGRPAKKLEVSPLLFFKGKGAEPSTR